MARALAVSALPSGQRRRKQRATGCRVKFLSNVVTGAAGLDPEHDRPSVAHPF